MLAMKSLKRITFGKIVKLLFSEVLAIISLISWIKKKSEKWSFRRRAANGRASPLVTFRSQLIIRSLLMAKKVKKVVIPAAGFGTRFLPATNASPKEMLPIVDKPIIQHVVEQAVAAGVEQIIIVTGWDKRASED